MGNLAEDNKVTELRFAQPWLLLLILLLPLVWVLYRRTAVKTTRVINRLRVSARIFCLLLLIIALAAPQIRRGVDRVNLMFLVDLSDSAGLDAETDAIDYINLASVSRGQNDTYGLAVFGADSSIETLPSTSPGELTIDSYINTSSTDLETALYTAVAAFPEGGENRIVLLSDGNETRGNAREAARVLRTLDISVYPVISEVPVDKNEVAVLDLIAPERVNLGQVHSFTTLIESRKPTSGTLFMFRNGIYMGEEEVDLKRGVNRFTYEALIDQTGSHIYEVFIQPLDDTIQENNEFRKSIQVAGEPAILYVHQPDGFSIPFLESLTIQNIRVTSVIPEEIPANLQSMLMYDAVIFDNVPAFDMSIASMELIERYVRDSGGGFLMIGGDQSFGVGGYFNTPVEKMLPVDMDVTSSKNTPSLALFMIVDKSGSMGDTIASGETKLDLVKEAVIASIEVLNPYYTVGLLAFDADFEWTVAPIRAGSRTEIINDMKGLASGGGTKLFPALTEGFEQLKNTPAAVKHILILSDGITDEENLEELVQIIGEERITVSTVSVGSDSDRELMSNIAELGGGRSYFTDDIKKIPRIFASESIIVSKGLIVEEPFFPLPGVPSEITDGLELDNLPALNGFVLTYPKTGAQQVLAAFNNNPLLSTWRYGLGRSAAFTSDFKGKWGTNLVAWEKFPAFSAQLIRWLRRPPSGNLLRVSIDNENGIGEITADAVDSEDNFINYLNLEAIILPPDGKAIHRQLTQTAPGCYGLEFRIDGSGDYHFTLYGSGGETTIAPDSHVLTVPYPPEYIRFAPDYSLLSEIAEITKGKTLSPTVMASDQLFLSSGTASDGYVDLWKILLVLAIVFLLADIAVRQLLHGKDKEQKLAHDNITARIKRSVESQPKMTYAELQNHMKKEQRKESEGKDLSFWFGNQRKRPDTTLRLYLAKKQQK